MAEQDGFAALDAKLEADFDALPDNMEQAAETPAPAQETQSPAEPSQPTAAQTAAPPASDPSPGQTPAQSKNYQDFLGKYGGDADAAATAYWDTNNRAAQLSARVRELEAKLAEPPATPTVAPTAPQPPAVPQEIQRYDTDMREAEAVWKQAGDALQVCQTEKTKIARQQDRIRRDWTAGRIPLDSEEAARRQMVDLDEATAEYDREIQRLEAQRAENVRDYRDAKERKGLSLQVAELANARQAEITKQNEASLQRFGQTFFGLLPSVASEGTEKIPDNLLPRFKELAKKEALLRLTAPGTDLDQQDIPAFLRQIKTDFLSLVNEGHKAKSAQYAAAKTEDTKVNAPEGQKAAAPVVQSSRFSDREALENHLDSRLGI